MNVFFIVVLMPVLAVFGKVYRRNCETFAETILEKVISGKKVSEENRGGEIGTETGILGCSGLDVFNVHK